MLINLCLSLLGIFIVKPYLNFPYKGNNIDGTLNELLTKTEPNVKPTAIFSIVVQKKKIEVSLPLYKHPINENLLTDIVYQEVGKHKYVLNKYIISLERLVWHKILFYSV